MDTRFERRRADFSAAAARLLELSPLDPTDVVRDATIRRFRFTFEACWKSLQAWFAIRGLVPGSPKAVLTAAFREGLIIDEPGTDAWLDMLNDRNMTSHAYNADLAAGILESIRARHCGQLAAMAERVARMEP